MTKKGKIYVLVIKSLCLLLSQKRDIVSDSVRRDHLGEMRLFIRNECRTSSPAVQNTLSRKTSGKRIRTDTSGRGFGIFKLQSGNNGKRFGWKVPYGGGGGGALLKWNPRCNERAPAHYFKCRMLKYASGGGGGGEGGGRRSGWFFLDLFAPNEGISGLNKECRSGEIYVFVLSNVVVINNSAVNRNTSGGGLAKWDLSQLFFR